MAQPASPAYRQYLRRSLVTGIAAALVLIIVVFLAHDAVDHLLTATLGLASAAPTPC
jgi:uncharacterized membrane protein YgaE (UPF0421/DUF939 family)